MKPNGADAHPLHWPTGWPRTKSPQSSRFEVGSFAVARDGLFREIRLLGGAHIVLSTNIPLRLDGIPYSGYRQPTDKGAAVYFVRKGRTMVFACDRWDKIEDNIRAIEKTIEAVRGIDRWGASEMLERAVQAFEALPPPKSCWNILGIPPGSSADAISRAYRDKARAAHPDTGGTATAMAELNKARDDAMQQSKARG